MFTRSMPKLKLVSIITPCYNMEKYIGRLLESVLNQDYPLIEMLVIDDGSIDNSSIVVKQFIPKFSEKGYSLEYLYQDNQGQSVAINNALKWVKGEYLLWPDSDDYYNRKDAVSCLVNHFYELPDNYGMIRTVPKYVDENSLDEVTTNIHFDYDENQFENALYNNNFAWAGYMVRVNALDKTIEDREIFTHKRAGQNWQIVLPILYNYKCHTLNESIISVLVRNNSHSRQSYQSEVRSLELIDAYESTIIHTLDAIKEMRSDVASEYKRYITLQHAHQRLMISCYFGDKYKAKEHKETIKVLGGNLSLWERIKYVLLLINLYPLNRINDCSVG